MSTEIITPAARLRAFGLPRIAEHFDIQYSAARKWLLSVPAERVPEVSRVLGCKPHDLRPDLWGPDDTGPMADTIGAAIPSSNGGVTLSETA